jgi:hypothetical protein
MSAQSKSFNSGVIMSLANYGINGFLLYRIGRTIAACRPASFTTQFSPDRSFRVNGFWVWAGLSKALIWFPAIPRLAAWICRLSKWGLWGQAGIGDQAASSPNV